MMMSYYEVSKLKEKIKNRMQGLKYPSLQDEYWRLNDKIHKYYTKIKLVPIVEYSHKYISKITERMAKAVAIQQSLVKSKMFEYK